jgi:hypothetical protein
MVSGTSRERASMTAMPKFKVTYASDGAQAERAEELLEADTMAEGPHFLILIRGSGEQAQPVLRIRARDVARVERLD